MLGSGFPRIPDPLAEGECSGCAPESQFLPPRSRISDSSREALTVSARTKVVSGEEAMELCLFLRVQIVYPGGKQSDGLGMIAPFGGVFAVPGAYLAGRARVSGFKHRLVLWAVARPIVRLERVRPSDGGERVRSRWVVDVGLRPGSRARL